MRYPITSLMMCGAMSLSLHAQKWEVGGLGGDAMQLSAHVTNAAAEANVKFKNAGVLGAYGGQNMYRLVGGEVRYLWRYGAGELSSGATKQDFSAHQQSVTYDILVHFTPREKSVRPYFAFGGGAKWVTGTGNPVAFPPLVSFGAFTAATEVLPVADVAFGVKMKVGRNSQARVEFRDAMSPIPGTVFTAAPGNKSTGWMNDMMIVVGLGWTW